MAILTDLPFDSKELRANNHIEIFFNNSFIIPTAFYLRSRSGCDMYPADNTIFLASLDGINYDTLDSTTTSTQSLTRQVIAHTYMYT